MDNELNLITPELVEFCRYDETWRKYAAHHDFALQTNEGLPVVTPDKTYHGNRYAIAMTEKAADAVAEMIVCRRLTWFDTHFLMEKTGASAETIERIKWRATHDIGANHDLYELIIHTCGLPAFLEDAMKMVDRGSLIADIDGVEHKLPCGYLAYRVA